MQAKKKKDNRGRVLWTGESQRKSDLIYQYRYTDENHNRKYIYNVDLDVLREMEEKIVKKKKSGLSLAKPKQTVNELIDSYLETKQGVRYNTKKGYRQSKDISEKVDLAIERLVTLKFPMQNSFLLSSRPMEKGIQQLLVFEALLNRPFKWHLRTTSSQEIHFFST